MAKSKKFSMLLFSFVLVLASFLFGACGSADYSNTYLSASPQYLEVFVGEEKNVTITIENPVGNMRTMLLYENFSDKCDVVETTHNDFSTTYTIIGNEGGKASVKFTAVDGDASIIVDIVVRQYAPTLSATRQAMFITQNVPLVPSSTDFSFDNGNANITERDLEYYFYGNYEEGSNLTIDDIKAANGELANSFVSARLIKQDGSSYIIFTDADGFEYTISKDSPLKTGLENKRYFVSAEYDETEKKYEFDINEDYYDLATVNAGETYVFLAKYDTKAAAGEETLTAAKKVNVLDDITIDASKTTVSYKEKKEGATSFQAYTGKPTDSVTVAGMTAAPVTLIPYYTPTIGGKKIDFLTSYVRVELPSYNPLLKIKTYSTNPDVVTGKIVSRNDEKTVYWLKLECATGSKSFESFIFNLYYEGFESVENSAVNFKYEIPVEVRNVPNTLFINGYEYGRGIEENAGLYTFYNHYVADAGWVPFKFDINPVEAEYSKFIIDFTGTGLEAKYQFGVATSGEFEVKDISRTIYVRGIEGTDIKAKTQLPIKIKVDFIGEEVLEYNINYEIKKGATTLNLNEDFKDGVYLDINQGEKVFAQQIIADAEFQYITVNKINSTDKDVSTITLDAMETKEEGVAYYLNLKLNPKQLGDDVEYEIFLDNGVKLDYSFNVSVKESLESVFIESNNENNLIRIQTDEPNTFYIYNDEEEASVKRLDLHIYSNKDKESKAIEDVSITLNDSSTFSIYEQSISKKDFTLRVLQNGKLESYVAAAPADDYGLIVEAIGHKVEDFKKVPVSIKTAVKLYAYSFIDGIYANRVEKDETGAEVLKEANYASVYTNVNTTELRQVTFDFGVVENGQKGFLFKNEATDRYEASSFNKKFFYWEVVVDGELGKPQILTYSGESTVVLSVDEGDFILDYLTGRLTFIAKANLLGNETINLLTHVRQYGKLFTYTTKIQVKKYIPVERISIQGGVEKIKLSAIKREFALIAFPQFTDERPTNPRITYSYETSNPALKNMFDGVNGQVETTYDEGTRSTYIHLSISETYAALLNGVAGTLTGSFKVFAADWVDKGSVVSGYTIINIPISFENGSEDAPFTLESAEDLLAVKNNMKAHYRVDGMIDASSIKNELPLGGTGAEFEGSISGTHDFSKIYGLDFDNGNKAGLFAKIATNGKVRNLTFEGSFKWETAPTVANIGLIAGINEGTIENVSVVLGESTITLSNQKFGVIAGQNKGLISQNFSRFDTNVVTAIDQVNPPTNADYDKIYAKSAPKTLVYFNKAMRLHVSGAAAMGGIAGVNEGTIQKVGSVDITKKYYGYTNYTAYIDMTATKPAGAETNFLGGIAGQSTGIIKGILVGGHVSNDSTAGGVAGTAGSNDNALSNIKTRVFVRSSGNFALVANWQPTTGSNIPTITVEAVDDGRYGKEASMGIAYAISNAYVDNHAAEDINNKIFFGLGCTVSKTSLPKVSSYLNRTYIDSLNTKVSETAGQDIYYGDFIVLDSEDKVLGDERFAAAAADSLKITENFRNQMKDNETNPTQLIFYTFFFKPENIASGETSDMSEWQNLFDLTLNTHASTSALYPFVSASEDVRFTSVSPDILTISQNGTISIKSTGLAHIRVTSILNTNAVSGLDFSIFVTNYFNSESKQADNEKRTSIVYPNASPSSVAIDNTVIDLRGDNTAMLYVRPQYTFTSEKLTLNALGEGHFNGVLFNIAANEEVTAKVTNIDPAYLNIVVGGQTIYIKRNASATEETIKMIITPIVKYTEGVDTPIDFIAAVNKQITNTQVNYARGAVKIENKTFDSVAVYSSTKIEDVIKITSTTDSESAPLYRIVNWKGEVVQGTYNAAKATGLFNVGIAPISPVVVDEPYYYHYFNLSISINEGDDDYKNRHIKNIYGAYTITFYAASNNAKTLTIDLIFRQTDIVSILIDNYTKLSDAKESMPVKSDKAYPGESGLLEITISPKDAAFDKIVIENDSVNYTQGHANAAFTLLARNNNIVGADPNIFESTTITGAQGANGLEIRYEEILNLYTINDAGNKYVDYDGIIYIRYDFSSENVLNDSISTINVKFMKDGQIAPIEETSINLVIKLQQFVGIKLDGKSQTQQGREYYSAYAVARGLSYPITVESYGFTPENIKIESLNKNLGEIVEDNGKYYLNITPNSIVGDNTFEIVVSAQEGERQSTNTTHITVKDFVFDYDKFQVATNPDIVDGMGGGEINVQIGTQKTLQIDLYDYIEYDDSNYDIITIISNFLKSISEQGSWIAYTNLDGKDVPQASNEKDGKFIGEQFDIGYVAGTKQTVSNYYFKADGLNIIPVHTHKALNKGYYITVSTSFVENGTGYAYSNVASAQQVTTTFILNVFTSSSEDSPIPLYNYQDLVEMESGVHYILMNNVALPDDFTPININFASFDGNGNTIIFNKSYDLGASETMSLFSSIDTGVVVKNLNIAFAEKISIATTADSFDFAPLAISNGGIITNCHVIPYTKTHNATTKSHVAVRKMQKDINGNNVEVAFGRGNIAGLVVNNNGSITNSSVELSLESTAYIAGVVASNSGKIAATAYKGGTLWGKLANTRVAGFVLSNAENGQIITSYVSGQERGNKTFYSNDCKIISSISSAGFVYDNLGLIKDCYSDANMTDKPSNNNVDRAGFVYNNGGTIRNVFSLAFVGNNSDFAAGFAADDEVEGQEGKFENCYYYSETLGDGTKVNVTLKPVDETYGIKRLTKDDFANLSNFETFSYDEYASTKAVWFYSKAKSSSAFATYGIACGEENSFTEYTQKTLDEAANLPAGRLELVSANVFTISRRINPTEIKNELTGDIVYQYTDDGKYPNRGSVSNPYLITSAQNMESLILENSSALWQNRMSYRIIADINYDNEETGVEGYSSLFNVIYAGVLEGNGMEIENIGLVSMEKLTNAGMFAQIGISGAKTGSVKNLTIRPAEVAFNSAGSVGTLAGVLNYGYIYDITVGPEEAIDEAALTVSGKSFVGGVVGRAINSYEMRDIYSNVNVSAGNDPSATAMYSDRKTDYDNYSYSGSIAGYLGVGKAYNMHVNNVRNVMGGRTGFAYGGIGEGADIRYTFVNMQPSAKIRAYNYGGFVVGEVAGQLTYSHVKSSGQDETPFLTIPKAASAVGGIAGRLGGGTINHAVMEQPFKLVEDDNGKIIENIGGIVGLVMPENNQLSTIENSIMSADITTCTNLGGAVGQASGALIVDAVAIKAKELSIVGQRAHPALGGIVARLQRSTGGLAISNSYITANLNVNTYTSGIESIAKVGSFIAYVEGASLTMKSCYSTSDISADVVDIRKIGESEAYSSATNNPNISFEQNVQQGSNIVDVYYLGSNASATGPDAFANATNISFNYRVKSVPLGLQVNQFGKSIYSYNYGSSKEDFYGIFGADYDYYDKDAGKHFYLRVDPTKTVDADNATYKAFDELREFLLDYQYRNQYIKERECSQLSIGEFESSSIDAEPIEALGGNIVRDVYYKMDGADVLYDKPQQAFTVGGVVYKYESNKGSFCKHKGVDFDKDANGQMIPLDLSKITKYEVLRDKGIVDDRTGTTLDTTFSAASVIADFKAVGTKTDINGDADNGENRLYKEVTGYKYKGDTITYDAAQKKFILDGKSYVWTEGKGFYHSDSNTSLENDQIMMIEAYKERTDKLYPLLEKSDPCVYTVDPNDSTKLKRTEGSADYCTEEVKIDKLVEKLLYKDSKHNVYRRELLIKGTDAVVVYRNIENEKECFVLKDNGVETNEWEVTAPIPAELTQVWDADNYATRLTVLNFENHLDWLGKA